MLAPIVPSAVSAVLLFWSAAALADFSGTVVAIHDGDTLTVLVERKQVKIRIADIDAFGSKAGFRLEVSASPGDVMSPEV